MAAALTALGAGAIDFPQAAAMVIGMDVGTTVTAMLATLGAEVIHVESPKGVIVQYGGQTPLKLARGLEANGAPIIGTSADAIDHAEDRERFQQLVESLELKLGEQILKETPKFNIALPFLKIISVVAPLLGLLGTVTGMIITFQAITLYGAGDPKLMAGGISTALVTTVLGLCVAIPTVFLHTLVQSRAKRLTQILQEEAAGMLSERAEKMG